MLFTISFQSGMISSCCWSVHHREAT